MKLYITIVIINLSNIYAFIIRVQIGLILLHHIKHPTILQRNHRLVLCMRRSVGKRFQSIDLRRIRKLPIPHSCYPFWPGTVVI